MDAAVDLYVAIDPDGGGADWSFENGDLVLDRGLRSTVLASLFSDARRPAASTDPDDADEDPRGVWFDRPGERYGSLLWLLDRSKSAGGVEVLSRSWITEALEWLVEDRIARSVDVVVERGDYNRLDVSISISKGDDRGWSSIWTAESSAVIESAQATVRILTR